MTLPIRPKSRSVLGATELSLLAPLKRGLIPALDSRSFATRAQGVLETLHALGVSRREIDPTPAIDEVADAIRSIRSFRMSIVGSEQRQVLLSVSFDGGWEPYMRKIWRPLGPLLDLVFCNCEGYLLSTQHAFAAYTSWVRKSQVETSFYYEASPLTVADQALLRDEKGQPLPAPAAAAGTLHEQARAALVGLYRLTDMFPDRDGQPDAEVLRAAARLLLRSLMPGGALLPPAPDGWLRTPSERAAWAWFRKGLPDEPPEVDEAARLEALAREEPVKRANVQAGILAPYEGLAHGRLALVGLPDAAAAEALLAHLNPKILSAAAPPYQMQGPVFVNLAFTAAGLARAGVDAGTLESMPQEFREGMEARASILGDWQHNHPMHWTLPQHRGQPGRPVQLSSVHALVQFSLVGNNTALLDGSVASLEQALQEAGGELLSVQAMSRIAAAGGRTGGHFGFVDGISQPRLPVPGAAGDVAAGDLLLGYTNRRGDPPPLKGWLWNESSFLVVRKLRQDVAAFEATAPDEDSKAALMGRHRDGRNLVTDRIDNDFDYAGPAGDRCPLHAHIRRANPRATRWGDLDHVPRLLRRGMSYGPVYDPQVPGSAQADRGLVFMAYNASIAEQFERIQGWLGGGNSPGPGSFSGQHDPLLGVPRAGDPRRYAWVDAQGQTRSVELPPERPLVALQWGLYAFVPSLSALRDLHERARDAAAEDAIDDLDADLPADPDQAEALQRKRDRRTRTTAAQAALGARLIAALRRAEPALGVDAAADQWKLALEDLGARSSGASQALWTAVRQGHGGVLRTPYGVLVCSKLLVDEVFVNAHGRYSVSGYNQRLGLAFGETYLGRDDGGPNSPYRAEAGPANAAILAVTREQAFDSAFAATEATLQELTVGVAAGESIVLEVKDLVDGLLSRFCQEWFGLPDGRHVQPGGWHWRPVAEATCPGHFHAPSRYTFQPRPGDEVRDIGQAHGRALKTQVDAFVADVRAGRAAAGRLGSELFKPFPNNPAGNDRLATTLIGVMMGFLPTVDGNLRGVLYEWTRDRSLWQHQDALTAAIREGQPAPSWPRAEAVLSEELDRAMQLRPVPELVWRTVLEAHTLGEGPHAVALRPGDTVVVSIVSATQEELLSGRRCPYTVFGGQRKATPTHPLPPLPPTHACPGFDIAQGVMLGFLAALLERAELRPAQSPLALRVKKA